MSSNEKEVSSNSVIAEALKNPALALLELERIRCEESLYEFIQSAWHTIHPGTPFEGGWAIETMCRHLEAVTNGEINRLLINVPPGCTKSMLVNVFWPAWEWGPKKKAHHKFISTAHNKELPIRDMDYCRDVIKSEWYRQFWKIEFKRSKDGKQEFANTEQGVRYAGSVGSKLTGRRGHRFIIDDPHSVASAESDAERHTAAFWFTETTPTRFDDPKNPVYVIIMQRLHEADVSGIVIKKLQEQGWVHLCLPMEFEKDFRSHTVVPSPFGRGRRMRRVLKEGEPLPYYVPDKTGKVMWPQDPRTDEGELLWEARYDRDSVEDLKIQFRAEGGSYAEAAQLQQRPVPRGGGMFKRKDWVFYDKAPECATVVRGWDLAATKDGHAAYTVGLKLGRTKAGAYVVLDVIRWRGTSFEVEEELLSCAERDRCPQSIPQDPGQAGKSQKNNFAVLLDGHDIHFSPESGEKKDRARPIAAQHEAGNLGMVRASWNDALIAEGAMFPNGDFLDQIDALSRAHAWILAQKGPGLALTPGMVVT